MGLSPASIVCHGLTSGIGKLFRCANFATPGSCRNLNCYHLYEGIAMEEQLSLSLYVHSSEHPFSTLCNFSLSLTESFTLQNCHFLVLPSLMGNSEDRQHLCRAPRSRPSICCCSPCGLQDATGRHFLTLLSFH